MGDVMVDKRKKDIEELIEKLSSIIEEEEKKNGIKLNICPITFVNFYNSLDFKNKFSIKRLCTWYDFRKTGGFYSREESKGYIFVDRMGNKEKSSFVRKLAINLFAIYHEIKHKIQHDNCDNVDSDNIINIAEEVIKDYKNGDYDKRHDKYFFEIDADLYAISKTRDYFRENFKDNYSEVDEFLIKRESLANYNLNNIDYQDVFDKFYRICKKKYLIIASVEGFDVFFDIENNFKSVLSIMNNEKLELFDDRVICGILGSKSFIASIQNKYTELSVAEKIFMTEIFNKIIINEYKKINENYKFCNNKEISMKKCISMCNDSSKKISFFQNEIKKIRLNHSVEESKKVKVIGSI